LSTGLTDVFENNRGVGSSNSMEYIHEPLLNEEGMATDKEKGKYIEQK
jgi:hypothetical protein